MCCLVVSALLMCWALLMRVCEGTASFIFLHGFNETLRRAVLLRVCLFELCEDGCVRSGCSLWGHCVEISLVVRVGQGVTLEPGSVFTDSGLSSWNRRHPTDALPGASLRCLGVLTLKS